MEEMDDRLFQWWQVFFDEEPFGPEATNWFLAQIAQMVMKAKDIREFYPPRRDE